MFLFFENPAIFVQFKFIQIFGNKKAIGFKSSAMVCVISLIGRLLMHLLKVSRKNPNCPHIFPRAREQIDQQKISWSPICGVLHLINFAQWGQNCYEFAK